MTAPSENDANVEDALSLQPRRSRLRVLVHHHPELEIDAIELPLVPKPHSEKRAACAQNVCLRQVDVATSDASSEVHDQAVVKAASRGKVVGRLESCRVE